MKMLVLLSLMILASCHDNHDNAFNKHIKNNKREIIDLIDYFKISGLKKITYGSPDFVTLTEGDDKSMEFRIDRKSGASTNKNISIETALIASKFIDKFESIGVNGLELSNDIYVTFTDGGTLIISSNPSSNSPPKEAGRKIKKIFPGWYSMF